ncbi:hypothetical protein [Actinomadura decatromicini]|uniref:Uncharacterized protein n=1 Tax=Actinomadura decatromicini TaxID=2604572 RepID=A0A5D3F7A0_9ACTN|nr:hypothetical protein [Actinomadura decatromicini]TYK43939.1 hypothetical protein FXF68_34985 [Actinomadura decatromicini]
MNRYQLGLLLCVLSAVLDLDGVVALGQNDPPPVGVAIGTATAGFLTCVGAVAAWRGRRSGVVLVVASRLTSALAFGVPAYFIGAPGWVYAAVGAGIALTVAGLGLTLASLRRAARA